MTISTLSILIFIAVALGLLLALVILCCIVAIYVIKHHNNQMVAKTGKTEKEVKIEALSKRINELKTHLSNNAWDYKAGRKLGKLQNLKNKISQ